MPGLGGIGFAAITFSTKGQRGHLTFNAALERLVQHMQGVCAGETKSAVFITDNWDPVSLDFWLHNLLRIHDQALLEIYLITGPTTSMIRLR